MGELFGGYTYEPHRWQTWTSSGDDGLSRTYTIHHDSSGFASTVDIPSMWPSSMLDPDIVKKLEMEEPKVSVSENDDPRSLTKRRAVACSHEPDLAQDRILKSLSAMKAKLMLQCAPVKIENIECRMTPAVKDNIIMAYRKLQMYGKKTPFVARFDEYGRRLPDEIKIDTIKGMTIKILDPEDYGKYHIEFEGIVRDAFTYDVMRDYTYVDADDVPF